MIPNKPFTLLSFQILAHLAVIPMIIYATWWQWCIVLFVYFLNGCLGMTMTYHRLLSHKSWLAPKWIEYLFTIFATIGLTGSAITWVAVHRMHHSYADTDKDPHNPKTKGYFWSHFLSMFANVEIRFAAKMLKEKFYVFQHRYYFELNLVYASILYCIDPFAVIYAWLVPAMLLWNCGSSIVSISHRGGYPHNDLILAILVWGEGYHANHHTKGNESKFGKFDLGGILINMLDIKRNDKS